MSFLNRVAIRYFYIFNLAIWLVIDGWYIYKFYANISSNLAPRLVSGECDSILSYLFWIDLSFCLIGFIISAQILKLKQTGIYFVFTYVVYAGLTIFSLFKLGDTLIHYQQQQGVWAGGSPMGQFLYLVLILAVGIITSSTYILTKIISWVGAKLRDRGH